jgi:hypothetical protein
MENEPKMLSQKEKDKLNDSRILSDADLVKKGAATKDGRLEVTEKQFHEIGYPMEKEKEVKKLDKIVDSLINNPGNLRKSILEVRHPDLSDDVEVEVKGEELWKREKREADDMIWEIGENLVDYRDTKLSSEIAKATYDIICKAEAAGIFLSYGENQGDSGTKHCTQSLKKLFEDYFSRK